MDSSSGDERSRRRRGRNGALVIASVGCGLVGSRPGRAGGGTRVDRTDRAVGRRRPRSSSGRAHGAVHRDDHRAVHRRGARRRQVRETDLVAYRDPVDHHLLVVRLPVVNDGLYQVRFEVRDGEDLHEVTGRTSFAVGAVSASPLRPATGAPPSPFESASRWIFAAGLALLAGVLTFRGRWPDIPIGRPRRLAALAGIGLAAVVAGRLGVASARALDLGIGFRGGLAHVARTAEVRQLPAIALAAACTVPAVAARRFSALDLPVVPGRRTSFRSALGWIGVVWLAVLAGTKDHSALLGSIELEVAGAKALHLIGLAVWIGALVVALAVGGSRQGRIAALAAVKRPALVGFVVTVGSGLLLAGRLVVSITGLLSTGYGLLLVAKVALIPVAIACGMMVRRHGPRMCCAGGSAPRRRGGRRRADGHGGADRGPSILAGRDRGGARRGICARRRLVDPASCRARATRAERVRDPGLRHTSTGSGPDQQTGDPHPARDRCRRSFDRTGRLRIGAGG